MTIKLHCEACSKGGINVIKVTYPQGRNDVINGNDFSVFRCVPRIEQVVQHAKYCRYDGEQTRSFEQERRDDLLEGIWWYQRTGNWHNPRSGQMPRLSMKRVKISIRNGGS